MSTLGQLQTTYMEECGELLAVTYAQLGALAEGHADEETIHAIFRAVHSIKGGGGIFGFDRLVAFAHELEAVLDRLREGDLEPGADLVATLLRAADVLSDLVAQAGTGENRPHEGEAMLLTQLRAWTDAGPRGGLPPVAVASEAPSVTTWRIRFAPHRGLLQSANEPLLLIRALRRLGECAVVPDLTALPDLGQISPESAYIAWDITLVTGAGRDAIAAIFEFVEDDCDLRISAATAERNTPATGAESSAGIPLVKQGQATAGSPPTVSSIRIDVDKIDRLVNLAGELVITQAMLVQLGSEIPPDQSNRLMTGFEALGQHLRDLQEGVMAIRAQPVGAVFARMSRLVRELSGQLHKDVRLVLNGETTEIDKMVIEQLADPLTHLLRNALDHGIESAAEREAAGKPACGTIGLSAANRGGRIVIEITDDGQGINRPRVLERARARGLVPPGEPLSDEEIDQLIFLQGFSTAESVSAISGRGVGMDVVRRNVQALGGRIAVDSKPGSGSRFVLSLPLTLAILDGMAVKVGRQTFIIPLASIVESLRPQRAAINALAGHGHLLAMRGSYIPILPLYRHFKIADAESDYAHGIIVILECEDGAQVGLAVDELIGQQQVVVKSLDANYGTVEGISGATILGTGQVALILDIGALIELAGRHRLRSAA